MRVGRDQRERVATASRARGAGKRRYIASCARFGTNTPIKSASAIPDIPRRVSGYNLPWLLPENGFHVARALVGSEGTLVTVLEATLQLVHNPPFRALVVLGYPDVYEAGDHVPEILEAGPVGLEGIDGFLIENMKKKGCTPRISKSFRRAKASCWSSSAAIRKRRRMRGPPSWRPS